MDRFEVGANVKFTDPTLRSSGDGETFAKQCLEMQLLIWLRNKKNPGLAPGFYIELCWFIDIAEN